MYSVLSRDSEMPYTLISVLATEFWQKAQPVEVTIQPPTTRIQNNMLCDQVSVNNTPPTKPPLPGIDQYTSQ